jgi:hypothetical protein
MFRKFWLSLSAVSLVGWCTIVVACGGSSNNKNCTGGPYNVVGDWQITVSQTSGASVSGYGAIDSSGLALFFDNSLSNGTGDTLQMPAITGSCAFSGNITEFAEPGGPFSGQSFTDTAQGNVTSATAITGTFTGSGGNGSGGSFSASTISPLSGTLGVVVGSKTGEVQGALNGQPVRVPLTFSASGTGDSMSFTSGSSNPSCTTTGTFTQVGTANVFDVSITFTSSVTNGCATTGTFTGIGFESSSDYFGLNGNSTDTYLYADIMASTNTFVMEIF